MIYLAYAEQRQTMRGIARMLSELGVKKPVERWLDDSRATLWSHSSIHSILTNSVYKGDWYYGKTIGSSGNGGKRSKVEQIQVNIPVIVDVDVWDAVQRISTQNAEIASRHRKRFYMFSGMVRCSCGCAMIGNTRRGQSFYRCNRRATKIRGLEPRECFEPQFSGKRLEAIVWEYVKGIMLGDFEKELAEAQQAECKQSEPLLRDLDTVKGMIAEVENEANALARSLGTVRGLIEAKMRQEMDRVNQRYVQLNAKKAEIEARIHAQPLLLLDVLPARSAAAHKAVLHFGLRQAKFGIDDDDSGLHAEVRAHWVKQSPLTILPAAFSGDAGRLPTAGESG